jgi:hypothetical protein
VRHVSGRRGVAVRRLPVRGGGRHRDQEEAKEHCPERKPVRPGGHSRRGLWPPATRRWHRLTLDLDGSALGVARKWVDLSDAICFPPIARVVVPQWSLASQRAGTLARYVDG